MLSKEISIIVLILLFSSCSMLTGDRKKIGDGNEQISKKDYNDLLMKYNKLKSSNNSNSEEKIEVKAYLETDTNSNNLIETVDIFENEGKAKKSIKEKDKMIVVSNDLLNNISIDKSINVLIDDDAMIENQIVNLRKADRLVKSGDYNLAMKHLKELELSTVRQINVRAKFLIGELLYRQNNYDLSMQIFEEIIKQDAFSGIILKALDRLIVCSSKLNLEQKRKQYNSILHDFFGVMN